MVRTAGRVETWKASARAYAAGLALAAAVIGTTPVPRPAPTFAIVRVKAKTDRFDPLETIAPGTVLTTPLPEGDVSPPARFELN